jgi:hypothetical protein
VPHTACTDLTSKSPDLPGFFLSVAISRCRHCWPMYRAPRLLAVLSYGPECRPGAEILWCRHAPAKRCRRQAEAANAAMVIFFIGVPHL